MPAERTMMENGRVAFYQLADPWTADEIVDITRDDKALLAHSPVKIHVLVDLTESRRISEGVLRLRNLPAVGHKMTGCIIVVGAPSAMKTIGAAFSVLSGNKEITYVDTVEEAWALIHEKIAEEDHTTIS